MREGEKEGVGREGGREVGGEEGGGGRMTVCTNLLSPIVGKSVSLTISE